MAFLSSYWLRSTGDTTHQCLLVWFALCVFRIHSSWESKAETLGLQWAPAVEIASPEHVEKWEEMRTCGGHPQCRSPAVEDTSKGKEPPVGLGNWSSLFGKKRTRVQAVSPPPWHAHLLRAWCAAIPHKAHGPITVILLTWQCLSALANFDKCNAKLSSVQPPQAILIKEGTGRSLGYFLQPGKNNHTSDFFKWPHSWVFFFFSSLTYSPIVRWIFIGSYVKNCPLEA